MDVDPPTTPVGFYGKLPAKGDFLNRGLSRDFVSVWDDWLQNGLNDSREILSSDWLDIYLTSPLWRFALSPGICGDAGWVGLMLPSMDRVGRYFPFTVAMPLPKQHSPLTAAVGEAAWFTGVAELALAALNDDDKDPDVLHAELAAVRLETSTDNCSDIYASSAIATMELATGVRLPTGEDLDNSRVVISLASAWLLREMEHCSFWWTEGSQIISPSLLCHSGLPDSNQFCALLDGRWASQGWTDPVGSSSSVPDEPAERDEPEDSDEVEAGRS